MVAATNAATDWYLGLLERVRKGEQLHGVLFAQVGQKFLAHADQVRSVSEGQRRNYRQKWQLLKPHFEGVKVADIDARFLLELRQKRAEATTKRGRGSSRQPSRRTWTLSAWCSSTRKSGRSA